MNYLNSEQIEELWRTVKDKFLKKFNKTTHLLIELFVAISNKSFNEMEKISSYLLFEEKNEISQPEFQFF